MGFLLSRRIFGRGPFGAPRHVRLATTGDITRAAAGRSERESVGVRVMETENERKKKSERKRLSRSTI